MRFIALKTCDGSEKGKLSFYCRMLNVSRQGFYDYLIAKKQPWKYQDIAEAMLDIRAEDVCNDTYGRTRMRIALTQRLPEGKRIPSEGTIQKIMVKTGLGHFKRRKPNGITKAERNARKSDNLIQRDFSADKPCLKCITDITEIKGRDGKLTDNYIDNYPSWRHSSHCWSQNNITFCCGMSPFSFTISHILCDYGVNMWVKSLNY